MKEKVVYKENFADLTLFKKLPKLYEPFSSADYAITADMYLFDWYKYSLEMLYYLKKNENFNFLPEHEFQ